MSDVYQINELSHYGARYSKDDPRVDAALDSIGLSSEWRLDEEQGDFAGEVSEQSVTWVFRLQDMFVFHKFEGPFVTEAQVDEWNERLLERLAHFAVNEDADELRALVCDAVGVRREIAIESGRF